jgi:hypothetical protein
LGFTAYPYGEASYNPTYALSLVCEQYSLGDEELAEIPEFTIESRVANSPAKKRK